MPPSPRSIIMSRLAVPRVALQLGSHGALGTCQRAIGVPRRSLPLLRAATPQCASCAVRSFSVSGQLSKKAGKANKAHARTDSAPPVSKAGGFTPTDEALDVSGLEASVLQAIEKLTHDLSQLRSGGKLNPDIVESLKVQLGTAGHGKESVRLGDIAQVVPRGRVLNVICGEEGHIKPISTAIAASPHSLTPLSPEPSNPLTIQVPLPPPTGETRRAAVESAVKASERADRLIQQARQEHNKKLRKFSLDREVLPDDLQKAKKLMEDVVKKGHTEVKRISDGAKRVLENFLPRLLSLSRSAHIDPVTSAPQQHLEGSRVADETIDGSSFSIDSFKLRIAHATMAPLINSIDLLALGKRVPEPANTRTSPPTRASMSIEGGFLEAWAQGYNVGSLIILILIVFCNYRSGIWLHKLILLELLLAIWHGTFIFVDDPHYGWYLSATASLLFISYFLHNVVSWLKIRPFLPLWGSRLFIISLLCVQPFWVAESWSNFAYFNQLENGSKVNIRTRPWEALVRDPWWIFTTWKLIHAIKKTYTFSLWTLICINRRFGVMLACMFLSIAFLLTDVAVSAAKVTASSGINPYWRFALVFKCASDTIFLDDFKSVLDDIIARKFSSAGDTVRRGSISGTGFHNHKRSRSTSRGEFIECSMLERVDSPSTNNTYSKSTRSKFRSSFSRSSQKSPKVPMIHIQQPAEVAQPRQPSQDSWDSEGPVAPRPAHTVYRNPELKANESDGSLLIGRLV
ncbi:hypothetical protein DDE82_001493 [Stemphylium lycopersici]|nr:hypothetical protein TW65_08330 [Stemphylium lycopersici]RAR09776.1 hypothetical protein DDE82_001493 [Stemphylium lycopersici]